MGRKHFSAMKIAILAALCAVASANQVHRFSVHSHSQKQLLDRFVDDHEGSEVWDSVPGSHMDVLVQDEHMVDADNLPLYRSTFIQDVNSLIELSETQQIGADASDFHTAYHSSKNIAGFLESLSKKHAHADLVQLGSTVMGQKMVGLRIGDKSKPEILLQGGQHAREWIAPGALAYAADKLLEKDSSGVLKDFSVMMIPAANPDGYDFSRKKSSRMWRKNMEDFSPKKFAMLMESELGEEDGAESCYGTDLNRNWADGSKFHKVVAGEEVSSSECSNTFQGSKPMSEREVQNLSKYIKDRKSAGGKIAAFVDVHSYSQKVIPAGCNNQKMSAETKQRHLHVTQSVAKAMSQVAGKSYTSGECAAIMYACSGVAHDWAHFEAKVPVSMAIELRDQGKYGFLVPPSMIKDTGKEMLAGVQALAKAHKETQLLVDTEWAENAL